MDVIGYVNQHHQLKQLVRYHNVNTQGIPPSYKNKINRVPTMLTQNGKILVGNEIKNWLDSLLPPKEVVHSPIGGFGCGMTTLDGDAPTTEILLSTITEEVSNLLWRKNSKRRLVVM